MNYDYGFTGTRKGMRWTQTDLLKLILLNPEINVVRHGCCTGADREFHFLVRKLRPDIQIIGHPPINQKLFAQDAYDNCDQVFKPQEYTDRNKEIVQNCNIMIGAPLSAEVIRSGTWQAIRFAIQTNKPTIILR